MKGLIRLSNTERGAEGQEQFPGCTIIKSISNLKCWKNTDTGGLILRGAQQM